MGIDYSFTLCVGFIVDKSDVLMPFTTEESETFHMEERYNPKTGKRIDPIRVVDKEGGERYELDGEQFDEYYELLEALSEKLKCNISTGGNYGDKTVYFSVELESTGEDDYSEYNIDTSYSSSLAEVISSKRKTNALAAKLKKLGIDPGVAKVYILSEIN